jgi:diphthamide biosynthesis methyltransferase
MGVKTEIIHNASIMNTIASCGLSLYLFGQTVSVCFWDHGNETRATSRCVCVCVCMGVYVCVCIGDEDTLTWLWLRPGG